MKNQLLPCPFCGGQWAIGQEPGDNFPIQGMWYLYHKSPRCFWDWSPPHFANRDAAIFAWNTRPAKIPQGWKLVPVEPTEEMCEAWGDASFTLEAGEAMTDVEMNAACARTDWSAMLDASPNPPVPTIGVE